MRLRTLPVELLLLSFFGLFLVYPLAYVLPGSASDEDFAVRLTSLGASDKARAAVSLLLMQNQPGRLDFRLPYDVATFPSKPRADELARKINEAGGQAEVVRQTHWTLFYFRQALGFHLESASSFPFFSLHPNSPYLWECLCNSLALASLTTLATTLLCLPLAYWMSRFRFRGQTILSIVLLVPLVLPPFVGGIGLEHFLGRFGTINLWLMNGGIIPADSPIDWLGEGGFLGVLLMQVLHLYPILYLNLTAAWANVDPALEDAARNLGASEFRVFRTVTFPLLLPGYFAGASLIFVYAFTDLGTPLVFQYGRVLPVQIFDQVSDPQRTNSVAYALVVITLAVTALLFYAARWLVARQSVVGGGKGAAASAIPWAGRRRTGLIWAFVLGLTLLAALPHVGVVLTACGEKWNMTPLPEGYTAAYLQEMATNRVAALSIRNSLLYSACGTVLDLVLGVTLAWLVVRRPGWLTSVLDGLATLPLALPGLVLAFGYLTCYSKWNLGPLGAYLDPVRNPVLLLIVAYAVRRLPYVTRSAQAGLQQIPPVLEEAAEGLGASRWRVARTVMLPLAAASVLAGAILTFAYALLEVSDSLMLAREEKFYPITRAIVGLLMRPDDGDRIASALGVVAMGILAFAVIVAGLVLGRRLGQLFRAG
jgi:iron(III) transport system permease protein